MKKIPVPDKPLKTDADIRSHFEQLIFNAMNWLKIDGYSFVVLLPNDDNFRKHEGAGASICVEFPYKKFAVSIQQDSVEKCRTQPLTSRGYWENVEQSIFHECVHVILWRTDELARRRYVTPDDIRDANEETTDHITHIIYPIVRDSRRKQKV